MCVRLCAYVYVDIHIYDRCVCILILTFSSLYSFSEFTFFLFNLFLIFIVYFVCVQDYRGIMSCKNRQVKEEDLQRAKARPQAALAGRRDIQGDTQRSFHLTAVALSRRQV